MFDIVFLCADGDKVALLSPTALLLDHCLDAGDLFLLLIVFSQLRLAVLGTLALRLGIIAVVELCRMMLDVQRFVCHAVEKVAVMRNDQHRVAVGGEKAFQPDDRLGVEVVGRLVEHQDVRLGREQARKRQPRALTAAELGDGKRHHTLVKAHLRKNALALAAEILPAALRKAVAEVGKLGCHGDVAA